MSSPRRPIGRPSRYAEYEAFEASLPPVMGKRPQYFRGIGIFQGVRGSTAYVKIHCPKGMTHRGQIYAPGQSIEIKLGRRQSFEWPEIIAEKDRLQALADKGLPLEATEVPTFAKYAQEWLDRKKTVHRSFAATKGNVHSALNPTFGRQPLNTITVADVNRWIGLHSAKLKPSSVQRHLAVFKAIMNDAVRNGLIERNPVTMADKIKGIEPRQRFITDAEWQTIMEAAERIESEQESKKEQTPQQIRGWLRHYIVWAYHSGMRRAEILALTSQNVREVADAHTVVEVCNTKTAKGRFVTCTKEMEAILLALAKLERLPDDTRLFPISMMTLKRSLSRLWKETGLKDVRLHDLRRTHATMLMLQNIDARTVAGRLGHSGTGMLATRYAVDRGDMEAAKRFDEQVVGARPSRAAAPS